MDIRYDTRGKQEKAMKILIVENRKTGEVDLEPYIPFPGQLALIEGSHFKCHIVESQLLALSYLDKAYNLSLDNDESIKKKIIKALKLTNWCQKEAAKLLKISQRKICYYVKKLNINHPEGNWRKKIENQPVLTLINRKIA